MDFTQQIRTILKCTFMRVILYVVVIPTLLAGCATFDTITGKTEREKQEKTKAEIEQQLTTCKAERDKLEKTRLEIEQQLTTCKAERDKLASSKADIEKQLSSERSQFEKKEAECKDMIGKLEKAKVKGMSVILFGGDIIYEVAVEAFKEYRAALRYRSLSDSNFATAFKMFEDGKGGDADILSVLKEIDTSGDRHIDTTEASHFRRTEEEKYGKIEKNSTAK